MSYPFDVRFPRIIIPLLAAMFVFSCTKDEETTVEPLEVCLTVSDGPYYINNSIQFNNCTIDSETSEWRVNGMAAGSLEDFEFTPDETGEYEISLVVTLDGRRGTRSEVITVVDYEGMTFAKTFPEESLRPEAFFQTSDGGLLIDYTTKSVLETAQFAKVMKLNSAFEVEWNYSSGTLFTNPWAATFREKSNGDYVYSKDFWVSGSSESSLNTLVNGGSLIPIEPLLFGEEGLKDYILKGDSVIYIGYAGGIYDFDLLFYITDLEGNFINSIVTDFTDKSIIGYDLKANVDGYISVSWSNSIGSFKANQKILVAQFDNNFSLIWSKEISPTGIKLLGNDGTKSSWKIETNADGTSLVFTYPAITKIDVTGNIIWSVNYFGDFAPDGSEDPQFSKGDVIRHENDFIIVYFHDVIRVNQEGNVVWNKKLRTGTGISIIGRSDYLLILADIEANFVANGNEIGASQVGLLKLDYTGKFLDF